MKRFFLFLCLFGCWMTVRTYAQEIDSTKTIVEADSASIFYSDTSRNVSKIRPRITVHQPSGGIKATTSKPIENVNVPDSVLRKRHNPTTAACLSIIPGGGQIYNKKYWKLPIVYGALGITGYFVYDFAHQMTMFKNEFINRRDGHTDKLNPKYAIYTDENVLAMRNYYRRNLEITVAVTAILYALNILDAYVDAHLYYFDISDDLSMNIFPKIHTNYYQASFKYQQPSLNYGVGLTLNFK